MPKLKPTPLPCGTVVGGYRVASELARSDLGLVYLARDPSGSEVVLKEYLPSALATRDAGECVPQLAEGSELLYEVGLKRFFEVGRLLAQISHPGVVPVLNFFRENETAYVVMDHLQGATLQDFIVTARERKQPKVFLESTIRSLLREVLPGLRLLHERDVMHLDLKPSNIFVTESDRTVLIDFGAARATASHPEETSGGTRPMYTPGFAAPEMYRPESSLGPWTDLYAIGACVYSCMRGYPPCEAPKRMEGDCLEQALEPLLGVYPNGLIQVAKSCMALDPLARPQSVAELQARLDS